MAKRRPSKSREVARESRHVPSQTSGPLPTDEVVGFREEENSIIDRLIGGSRQLRIVAIVGMPGLGKTTLATKVYNHPSVMLHFHVQAWCSVSQVFDEKKVLPELWNQVVKKLPDACFEKTEEDLATKLRRSLKGKRYLIFLDDVWDLKAWNGLRIILPDDGYGSRIIITSRNRDVAPQVVLDEEPLSLRQLTEDESWELLQKKLFPLKRFPPALCKLGLKIARGCKGLPLIIIIVARMLATMEQKGWDEVLEILNSGIISSTEQCMKTLELSYTHLPDHLKQCLLYFGAFPEDHEFSVKWLIWLWIGEGFIKDTNLKILEDVGRDYLLDLIGRSLVMVSKQRSIGGAKTCRIHDLLHDFCRAKAQQENSFQLLQSGNENFLQLLRGRLRLCNYAKLEHFKVPKLLPPHVHSLLFFAHWCPRSYYDISLFLHVFKNLEVLEMGKINLGSVFPSEIGLLLRLKYLAVHGEMEVIPSSIGNLSNLETFIVDRRLSLVSLPQTLWNLQNLRHLYINNNAYSGFILPLENLDNSLHLYKLESFSGVFISSLDSVERLMRKFPNIRKLRLKLFQYEADDDKILALDFLSRLESLSVSLNYTIFTHPPFEFCFPLNLKKLTLTYFWFPSSKISTIGNLPNLEVLKLQFIGFPSETWEIEEGEFLTLRFLKLSCIPIVKWTASDDQFPYLEKLVIESCMALREVPSCLESISTLEIIEVSNCPHSVESSIKRIQEEQMNSGNTALKVLIRPSGMAWDVPGLWPGSIPTNVVPSHL